MQIWPDGTHENIPGDWVLTQIFGAAAAAAAAATLQKQNKRRPE